MLRLVFPVLTAVLFSSSVQAEDRPVAEMRDQAVDFLQSRQRENGSWTRDEAIGISGLATTALLRSGVSPEQPVVARAIRFLLSQQRTDGGIYGQGSRHRNYETCIAVMALSEANQQGKYDDAIRQARSFLTGLQWDQGEGIESSDPAWGGGGYGKHQRPDLCNTEFLIEALKKAGVSNNDPAMQRVLIFVSRTQNLESEHNTTEFAGRINDGGFYYTPAAGGDSKAGTTENGGLRSYGSMTYAGVKSLIFAGLTADDPRVQAAQGWIRRNYTLEQNPGMGDQGLFYYYHTFAKTMNAFGSDTFEDATGKQHHWKQELLQKLSGLQQPNGSWVNPLAPRWEEGDPHLVTAYCLMALAEIDSPATAE